MLIRLLLGMIVVWIVTRTIPALIERVVAVAGQPSQQRAPRSAGRREALATLGLEQGASAQEVRRAYKRLSQKYHPDRVAHLGPEIVELSEEKFKQISAAYDALS